MPAAAQPLGNAKSLLVSNGLGNIHFPALSYRPARSLGNDSAAVTVTAAAEDRAAPAHSLCVAPSCSAEVPDRKADATLSQNPNLSPSEFWPSKHQTHPPRMKICLH